jgi:hypothetical protein
MNNEHQPVADLENAERIDVALRHLVDAVAEEMKDSHDKKEVVEAVEQATKHYDDVAVREFVPILVEREVREALRYTRA